MRSSDRGAVPILAILIGLFVAAATITTVVAVKANQGNNPGGFTLAVTGSAGSRDSNDLPIATVMYEVDYQNNVAPQALSTPLLVRCTITQVQLTQNRVFQGEGEVIGTTRVVSGAVVVAPGPDNKAVQGAYNVSCQLLRDGAVLQTVKGDDVVIPQPGSSPAPTASGSIADVVGTYQTPFSYQTGDATNCISTDPRMFVVTATGDTTIKVELDSITIYTGPLDSNLGFTAANFGLYPGHADYGGTLKAQFSADATEHLAGTFTTTQPPCTFTISADRS
jgi:hypothetical protein